MRSEPPASQPFAAVLLVQLGGRRYGLPLAQVQRVLPMAALLPLPDAEPGLAGVLNLHGEVLSVRDLRPRLGLPPVSPDPDQRLVLLAHGAARGLLWVDAVDDVVAPEPAALTSIDTEQAGSLIAHVLRTPDGLVPVLAVEALV